MLDTIPAFEIALLATPRDHRAIVAGYREEFPTGRGDRSPDPVGINGYSVLIQRYAGGSHVPVELAGPDDVLVCGCLADAANAIDGRACAVFDSSSLRTGPLGLRGRGAGQLQLATSISDRARAVGQERVANNLYHLGDACGAGAEAPDLACFWQPEHTALWLADILSTLLVLEAQQRAGI